MPRIGLGLGLGLRQAVAAAGGFDADAQAFFDRVTTAGGTLTTTEQNATNQLVLDMKSAGIWSAMKAVYPMVGASAAACAQNLKSSSFTGSFSSGFTFASTGVTGNGSSAYMDTGFNPSNELANNNASLGLYSNVSVAASAVIDMGAVFGGLYCNLSILWTGNVLFPDINGYGASVTNTTSLGFFQAIRISGTQVKAAINGSIATYTASSGIGRPNGTINLGRSNGIGYYSNKRFAFAYIGEILTDTQASNYYTAVQAFQTTLSRNV